MRLVGIDPGATGALVMLQDREPIEWVMMPTIQVGTSTRVNAAGIANWLKVCDPHHVYIERVGPMPKQGVTSTFNFGHSVGTIMGVVAALEIPHTLVDPKTWKKAAGLIGTDKDASRARALQMWPNWRDLDKKVRGQAYADAAFIALVGKP